MYKIYDPLFKLKYNSSAAQLTGGRQAAEAVNTFQQRLSTFECNEKVRSILDSTSTNDFINSIDIETDIDITFKKYYFSYELEQVSIDIIKDFIDNNISTYLRTNTILLGSTSINNNVFIDIAVLLFDKNKRVDLTIEENKNYLKLIDKYIIDIYLFQYKHFIKSTKQITYKHINPKNIICRNNNDDRDNLELIQLEDLIEYQNINNSKDPEIAKAIDINTNISSNQKEYQQPAKPIVPQISIGASLLNEMSVTNEMIKDEPQGNLLWSERSETECNEMKFSETKCNVIREMNVDLLPLDNHIGYKKVVTVGSENRQKVHSQMEKSTVKFSGDNDSILKVHSQIKSPQSNQKSTVKSERLQKLEDNLKTTGYKDRAKAEIEDSKKLIKIECHKILKEGLNIKGLLLIKRLKGEMGSTTIWKYWRECERSVREDFFNKFK